MKISYAIPVHNEREEIERLMKYLIKHKLPDDEIVIMLDSENVTKEVRDYVEDFILTNKNDHYIILCSHPLKKDFAAHKNYLSRQCTGDWIFLIDADEYPDDYLMQSLPFIIDSNPEVEAYFVPRINQVDGITGQHMAMWGWNANDRGWINFPDYQMRLYKNSVDIEWERPVHEMLAGYKNFGTLPANEEYCLWHPKDITRQEMQNKFYDSI
jgi:glycosyltransferase involved in cell wall biosynthesis